MSPEITQAKDFALPEGTSMLCISDPPACTLAEVYFAESLRKHGTEKLIDVPVGVLIYDPGISFVIVNVKTLLVKSIGVESGIILDPGLLRGFIASRIKTTDQFVVARPLRDSQPSLRKYWTPLKNLKKLDLRYSKLRERSDWGSEWGDNYESFQEGALKPAIIMK